MKKPRKARAPAAKHDPADIARGRELRDRYLEQVNRDPSLLLPAGKYEVARAMPDLSAQANTPAPVASADIGAGSRAVDVEVIPAPPLQLPAAA